MTFHGMTLEREKEDQFTRTLMANTGLEVAQRGIRPISVPGIGFCM